MGWCTIGGNGPWLQHTRSRGPVRVLARQSGPRDPSSCRLQVRGARSRQRGPGPRWTPTCCGATGAHRIAPVGGSRSGKTSSLRAQKSLRASARPHRIRNTPKTRPGVIGRGPRPTRPKWSNASAANRTAAIGNSQITVASYTLLTAGRASRAPATPVPANLAARVVRDNFRFGP